MHTLPEKVGRIIIGLPFHILRQRNTAGSCLRRIRKHPHCADQRRHNLLRPRDPVPIFTYRFKSIVCRHRKAAAYLQLLQDRIRLSGSEGIRREYKQRDIIDRSRGTGRHHIRSPRPHGGRTRDDPLSVALFGECDCRMAHALLISSLHHAQGTGIGIQRFPQSHRNSMSENSKKAFHKFCFFLIHQHILLIQKPHDCLGNRQSYCFFHSLLSPF